MIITISLVNIFHHTCLQKALFLLSTLNASLSGCTHSEQTGLLTHPCTFNNHCPCSVLQCLAPGCRRILLYILTLPTTRCPSSIIPNTSHNSLSFF